MNVTMIQMDVAFGSPEKNRKILLSKFTKLKEFDTDVVLLPELWTTGYSLSSLSKIAEADHGKTVSLLKELAKKYDVTIIAGSIALKRENDVYNTMFVIDNNGNLISEYSKVHLFKLMDEHLYMKAGDKENYFKVNGTNCSGFICYDIRFPEWVRKHAANGAEVLFISAEWPSQRKYHWRSLLIARAIENQAYVVACNRVGKDLNNQFSGGSIVIDPLGNVIVEGSCEEEILTANLQLEMVEETRKNMTTFTDRRSELY
jgi:omega-amidase